MIKAFISYRREDSQHQAGRLYDRLVREFGSNNVCMDVDSFPVGTDFRSELRKSIERCDVLLALIGDHWAESKDADGKLRLHRQDDFVRIEIETAFENRILVVPVLVGDKLMPSPDQMPVSIRKLAFRNGVVLRPGASFHDDVGRLLAGIVRNKTAALPSTVESESVPRTLPSPAIAAERANELRFDRKQSLWPVGSVVVAFLFMCIICVLIPRMLATRKPVVINRPTISAANDIIGTEQLVPVTQKAVDNANAFSNETQTSVNSQAPATNQDAMGNVGKPPIADSPIVPAEKRTIRLLSLFCDRVSNLNGRDQITIEVKIDGNSYEAKPSYPDNYKGKPCKILETGQTWDLDIVLSFDKEVTVTFRENYMLTGTVGEFVFNAATIEQRLPELSGRFYRLRWEQAE